MVRTVDGRSLAGRVASDRDSALARVGAGHSSRAFFDGKEIRQRAGEEVFEVSVIDGEICTDVYGGSRDRLSRYWAEVGHPCPIGPKGCGDSRTGFNVCGGVKYSLSTWRRKGGRGCETGLERGRGAGGASVNSGWFACRSHCAGRGTDGTEVKGSGRALDICCEPAWCRGSAER